MYKVFLAMWLTCIMTAAIVKATTIGPVIGLACFLLVTVGLSVAVVIDHYESKK